MGSSWNSGAPRGVHGTMRFLILMLAAALAGCASTSQATPEPTAARPEPTPAPAPAPTPAPAPPAEPFVEPEPRAFVDGRPSWRQEPWWTLHVGGELPVVVYEVGAIYGIEPAGRAFDRPWLYPRPPEDWLALRCPRCSHDANPDGRPQQGGVLAFGGEGELTDEVRERVAADFRRAAGDLPPDGELKVDEDGWVWLTHTPEAHLRVMDWLRPRMCPHR